MRQQVVKAVVLLVGTFLLLLAFQTTSDVPIVEFTLKPSQDYSEHKKEAISPAINILLVGDIMLGRNVESLMEVHGVGYPFLHTQELLKYPDVTIGNFEGTVSPIHEKAEPMTFKFSVKEEFLKVLQEVGFDILSLANNHSYDYGSSSFLHTSALCLQYALVCRGAPSTLDEDSVHTSAIQGRVVSFIFIHTLYADPDKETLKSLLARSTAESEIQIAYIHWGEEYALIHNEEQRLLAEFLIDHGIDTVVGHHPHVVQDVELYNGKPIFYSLGNFIFDQYFSTDVQETVALNMNIGTSSIAYSLTPLTSELVRSQPAPMNEASKKALFKRVFSSLEDSNPFVVSTGEFVLPL